MPAAILALSEQLLSSWLALPGAVGNSTAETLQQETLADAGESHHIVSRCGRIC
jgi:hypothetical protein